MPSPNTHLMFSLSLDGIRLVFYLQTNLCLESEAIYLLKYFQ